MQDALVCVLGIAVIYSMRKLETLVCETNTYSTHLHGFSALIQMHVCTADTLKQLAVATEYY